MRTFIVLFAAAALAACASMPAYQPAATQGGAGYAETRIEADRYVVTYRTPGGGEAALLQDYVLLRAAELTVQNGRDWFWMDQRSIDSGSGYAARGPSIGVGVGAGSWGRRSGTSVGVGIHLPVGGARESAQGARAEIRFGQGPKPDAANAYDARAVLANLQALRAGRR